MKFAGFCIYPRDDASKEFGVRLGMRRDTSLKGNRLTPHRAAVWDALRKSQDHPTAAEIFHRVRRRRPKVSYATIYNALNWLTGNGMAAELKLGRQATRYDPITERHDHLLCVHCGALTDCNLDLPPKLWSGAGRRWGFRAHHYRCELFGLCARCLRESSAKSGRWAREVI